MSADVLLVDNVDSFTYNVADLLHRALGRAPVVWRNDHRATEQDLARFAAIVVGPGPGRPQISADMGLSDLALRQDTVPVLGVCLGHQGLAHGAGAQVTELALTRHGIVSEVEHDGTGLFAGVPSPVRVVRYHSLAVREPVGGGLQVTARATDDGCVMAVADPARRRWGVQFHPESVLSEHGLAILTNFLQLAGVTTADRRGPGDPPGTTSGPVAVGDVPVPHPWATGGREVAVRAELLPGPVDPWALHQQLLAGSPTSVWLDASDGTGWSLLADSTGPLAHELTHRVGQQPPLLDRMDAELARWRLVGPQPDLPWCPGYVGYWGYELKAETGGAAAHRSPWPDAWLTFADRGVVMDHVGGRVWAVWLEDASVAQAQRTWLQQLRDLVGHCPPVPRDIDRSGPAPDHPDPPDARPRHDAVAYLDLVRRCQEAIARGESYEVCLTTSWSVPATGMGPADLYRAMRWTSPVPHGAWLRTPAVQVLGCSPERFVRVDGEGVVESRPIKGTRPRGADPEQDAALAADLASSVKDRAENLMIVDLLRNDLHRVCRAGSVHVPEVFAVESYATVHQLVSTVRGQLAPGMGPTDVLRSCFPGGSMTGAPKVRTMVHLDRLEGRARGVYAGAIGWVGLDGRMDTSIVIRTATWADGEVSFGVGGAVTALSDPGQEHAETLDKARAVLQAISRARARAARPAAARSSSVRPPHIPGGGARSPGAG